MNASQVIDGEIDADVALMDAGLDSLGAVELSELLEKAAGGATLPGTLIFDQPTARRLTTYLATREQTTGGVKTFVAAGRKQAGDVLILGLATQIPGGAHSPKFAWEMLAAGHDAISQVPPTRWSMGAMRHLSQPAYDRMRYGGFVRKAEVFDARHFAVSPAEAGAMDPQQRVLLERGYQALAESGLDKAALEDSGTGIFIGIQALDFSEILRSSPAGASVFAATGVNLAISSGRLSYVLGMQGPCASYDTACSAGLVACHAGARSVHLRECDHGLVAGINLMLTPWIPMACALAGMTSPKGHSHTFDNRADGFARAGGCSGVALSHPVDVEPLAIGRGCAVRQDGRSASLTAPSGEAQKGLLFALLSDAGAAPQVISYGEMHGTGTALGDPIEVGSYEAGILSYRPEQPAAALGSVKASVGHAEPGAGLVGLSKLMLVLRHARSTPNTLLRVINPQVKRALGGSRAQLANQLGEQWDGQRHAKLSGSVSSFGYSGTIANVLLAAATKVRTSALPPFHALPCPSMPFDALPCPSMPFDALRCPSMPLDALPCPPMPFHALC